MEKIIDGSRNWVHDCDACIFLGPYKGMDLYVCSNHEEVIVRFGDEGCENRSYSMDLAQRIAGRDEVVAETIRRYEEYKAYRDKR